MFYVEHTKFNTICRCSNKLNCLFTFGWKTDIQWVLHNIQCVQCAVFSVVVKNFLIQAEILGCFRVSQTSDTLTEVDQTSAAYRLSLSPLCCCKCPSSSYPHLWCRVQRTLCRETVLRSLCTRPLQTCTVPSSLVCGSHSPGNRISLSSAQRPPPCALLMAQWDLVWWCSLLPLTPAQCQVWRWF